MSNFLHPESQNHTTQNDAQRGYIKKLQAS